MDKQTMVHPNNGRLFSDKNSQNDMNRQFKTRNKVGN